MGRQITGLCVALCLALAGGSFASDAALAEPAGDSKSVYDRDALERLYRHLQLSQSAREANRIANEIWLIWTEGPDELAGEQIREIMRARRARNLDKALGIANKLTERLPDYAEGWNQKATVLFEMGRYDRSLEAVEKVLEREPKHFGALSGKAMILLRQGRVRLGQKALRRAVEIHPYLAERRFLADPPGERI